MASEAIKNITGVGESLNDKLLIFDALNSEFNKINVSKNPNCEICKVHHET